MARVLRPACVLLIVLFSSETGWGTERVVYPQAAVGPVGGDEFEIELRLGNRNPNSPWVGAVHLLEQEDLQGMQGLHLSRPDGPAPDLEDGRVPVVIPPGQSLVYRLSADRVQVGVMVIEPDQSAVADLVTSFFYRLKNRSSGIVTDLIAIQPALEAALSYNAMITRSQAFNVGVAVVADPAISAALAGTGPRPATTLTLTVDLADGTKRSTVTSLGGAGQGQMALFPHQVVEGLPNTFEPARLNLSGSDPIYATLMGVGGPPEFEDIQIGSAPAHAQASVNFPLRSGWAFLEGGADLLSGGFWECSGPTIREETGGLLSVAGPNWATHLHQSGARLEVSGDFGVLASLAVPPTGSGGIVLVGRLATGPEWWRGLRRLDLGVSNGQIAVQTWNNSPEPTHFGFLEPGGVQGKTQLELARVGDEFIVYAEGREAGRLPDFGLAEDGLVYLGTNVNPSGQLTLYGLAAEARANQPGSTRILAPTFQQTAAQRPDSLRALAERRALNVGAAVSPDLIGSELEYRRTLGSEFNMLTAENVMKWQPIHPARDRYSFCPADQLVAYARANGLKIRGHALVWHNQNPSWLTSGNFDRDELLEILRDHIFSVAGRFRGEITEWDVVNEAFEGDGSLRDTIWLRGIGPEYIDLAFQWAHAADPSAKLFYNDYSIEVRNRKSDAVLQLLQGMLQRGIPVHGVGFQAHLGAEAGLRVGKQALLENMRRFGDLGLETNITEFDVRLRTPATPQDLSAQAEVYQDLIQACLEAGSCTSFVMWGFTDKYSWIPGFFTGYGAALPFDEDYQPKPAYEALIGALQPAGAQHRESLRN